MSGVYDFEQYPVPYLDMEMLMEKQVQKKNRKLLVLSAVATVLMSMIAVLMLYIISKDSMEVFFILYIAFETYIVLGALLIGRFVKKGEYLCE